jgi:transcriptional regulator with XRE-family HTH domain
LRLDGAKVRRARERLGYSLAAVAQEAGVSEGAVLRADHGREIRLLTARKIAQGLGVEVADLMREEDR